MKKIATLMALLLLAGCSKKLTSVDDAVALAREKANLTDDNSELIKSSFEDGEYYVELIDQEHVYRYVIDDDGKVESFVKEVITNNEEPSQENTDTLINDTKVISREEALKKVLEHFNLTEDQVYEIEIDEDNANSDRLVYKIDFKTADTEYEAEVKGDGTLINDKQERNDDKVVSFTTNTSREEAINAALSANGHNYADINELTIKQVVYFDQSYYEVEYEIDHKDYDMIVDANTLETKVDD